MELTAFVFRTGCFETCLLQLVHKSITIKVIVRSIFRNSLCEVLKHISNVSRLSEDPLSHRNSFNELLEVAQYVSTATELHNLTIHQTVVEYLPSFL